MKLGIITRHFPPDVTSGRETVIYNLWQQATQHYRVELVTGWKNAACVPPPGAHIIPLTTHKFLNYQILRRQGYQILKARGVDLVLSNNIETTYADIPTVTLFYDFNFGKAADQHGWMERVKKGLARRRLRAARRIVAISQASCRELVRDEALRGIVSFIHNGVDTDTFSPRSCANEKWVISYPSRIARGKGQHIVLAALRELPAEWLNRIKVWIAGYIEDRAYYEELRQAAAGLPVEFHPNVAALAPYYQQADVVVFPTLMQEGYGYTALEGMACGKPVIYADDPAVCEATGGIGVCIPRSDAAALAQALVQLYADPARCAQLGAAGRQFVVERYAWAKVFRKYQDVLAGALPA